MAPQLLGEQYGTEGRLQLCYLRHAFGLGEHYNSTQPLGAAAAEDQQDGTAMGEQEEPPAEVGPDGGGL